MPLSTRGKLVVPRGAFLSPGKRRGAGDERGEIDGRRELQMFGGGAMRRRNGVQLESGTVWRSS
ncbi:hypothetical protein OE88DRAFT_1668129 [Heliocybe sulcata]|uniref:Uncharacterized protein n=1 Tax=Heliocybe sulcata TaxID=5364 RepID=A0A5C3MLE0_9AGAM|nr:hypothetical protein OE88DRAFT_1668129 [Heliocybe sulcata]